MRSVVVVLPASMWAMMPMFRQRSNGTVRGTLFSVSLLCRNAACYVSSAFSPPVVREGLICFRHAMDIFFLLDRGALAVGRIQQLVGQLVDHALFAALAAVRQNPANGQRRPAVGGDF